MLDLRLVAPDQDWDRDLYLEIFLLLCRVKLYAVFQGLREEGFDLSEILTTEFIKRCEKASHVEEKPDRQGIQRLLKTGMSLGMSIQSSLVECNI